MRLGRFFSRRAVRLLQYLVVIVLLVLFVPLAWNFGSERKATKNSAPDRLGADMPGAYVAVDPNRSPEERELQKRYVNIDGDPSELYKNMARNRDWHDYKAIKADSLRSGKGEQGTPVALPSDPETSKLQDQMYRVNGFDALASDQISLNRSVKDVRHPGCKKLKYLRMLPTVTVILPFHNEHNSTLLRSVYSILNRSPAEVVKEIILVDDASTKEFLKAPLDQFLEKHFPGVVKVVRTGKREGLIRARQIGAQHATQEIMIFLDSHSEPNYNWIPPLIEPIALNYKTIVCPFVDVIDCNSFEYRIQDNGARGSFDWEFNYKRLPITSDDTANPTRPFRSPVMAGGYFAINRKWFWELGGYDEGLDIWGGEQYELSFKVWQCHGQMVDAPCSRVGHIYRCKYVPFPNPGVGDFISRNYRRVAEVWMDEYKEHLYKRRPSLRTANEGDISKQKSVRERLKCKSFDWFMKEIAFDQDHFYPAVEPADGAYGEVRSLAGDRKKCLDTQFRNKDERFGLRTCISDDRASGGEQQLRLSFWKDIRPGRRSVCFDVSTSVPQAPVVIFPCHGMQGNQEWRYRAKSKQLHHPVSNQCLDCDYERGEVFMNPCADDKPTQQWQWDSFNQTVVETWTYKH